MAGIVYCGTALLANLLGATEFGNIALLIFLVKSLPSYSLGMPQGLIYYIYDNKTDRYIGTYTLLYSLILIIVSTCYALFYGKNAALLSLCLIPLFLLEPYLRTKNHLLLSIFPEVILVAGFLFVTLIEDYMQLEHTIYFFTALAVSLSLYKGIPKYLNAYFSRKEDISYTHMKSLVRRGGGAYIFNLTFFLFLLLDRLLVEHIRGSAEVGVLMLSYQLAIAAGFLVSALNFTAVIDFGESKSIDPRKLFKKALKKFISMIGIGITAYLCMIAFVVFAGEKIFPTFEGIVEYAAIIGLSIVIFNSYTAISPVLFFYRKNLLPVLLMIPVILIQFSLHYFCSDNLTLLEIELINFGVFTLAMIVCCIYVFKVLMSPNNEGSISNG